MGRRVPRELKVVRGTYRKDRDNPHAPQLPVAVPKCPTWLCTAAKRHWKELVKVLGPMRVLSEADGEALALAADALAEYVQARKVIEKQGHSYEATTEAGTVIVRKRPEVTIASDAWKRARLMLLEFGLTPAARGKVKAGPVRTPNQWEKFAQ